MQLLWNWWPHFSLIPFCYSVFPVGSSWQIEQPSTFSIFYNLSVSCSVAGVSPSPGLKDPSIVNSRLCKVYNWLPNELNMFMLGGGSCIEKAWTFNPNLWGSKLIVNAWFIILGALFTYEGYELLCVLFGVWGLILYTSNDEGFWFWVPSSIDSKALPSQYIQQFASYFA